MIHEFGSAGFDRLIESEQSERAALISPKVAASYHGSVPTDRNLSVQPAKARPRPQRSGVSRGQGRAGQVSTMTRQTNLKSTKLFRAG